MGNPTLHKFTSEIYFSGFLEKNIILCILKGEMPFKMHKSIFFPEKKIKKICVLALTKIFRHITRNTLIFYLALSGLEITKCLSE